MHASNSAPRTMADSEQPSTRVSNNDVPDHSVHIRSRSTAHTQSPKRLSVFSGRSRSNTTTSTTSSRRSPASSMTSMDAASLPSSQDERTSSAGVRSERQESMTKSLFSRGSRILRRQGSKFNIVATLDEEDEMEREKSRFEVSDLFSRHHRSRQSDAHEQLKTLISDPFDFHHLTHTSPSHFQAMDRARENDLVTEFSAIRASQRPITGLKGIRAEDLHFRDFSSENLANCVAGIARDQDVPTPISPPGSPGTSSSATSPKQQDDRLRRESRVCENFSRPYPRAGAITPPGLAASPEISEPAPRAIDEILGLSSPSTYPEHVFSNGDDEAQEGRLLHMNVESIFPPSIGQAIVPDAQKDTIDFRTSSMSFTNISSDLDVLPEEEEATNSRETLAFGIEKTKSCSQSRLSSPPTELQSTSGVRPKSNLTVYVSEELSKKVSEALGSPTLPQYRQPEASPHDQKLGGTVRRTASIRRRATYETIYESWDADIDYCYEHAAESNCNFDWARNSFDEPQQDAVDVSIAGSQVDLVNGANKIHLLPAAHLSTSTVPGLDLEPSPPRLFPSAQVSLTPSTTSYEIEEGGSRRNNDYYQPVSSSMFPSTLGKHLTHDVLYEEYLAGDAESDRHFSFCSQGVIQPMEQPVSPRSSFSPISKCNSEESLILSRAASIVRKHRSSVSTTSVPELVHSLANSRELSATDQTASSDHSLPSGPGQPESSSYHRQTKSLAREIETQVAFRADGSVILESAGIIPNPGPTILDRARSISELEATKAEVPIRGTHRRKALAKRHIETSLMPPPPPKRIKRPTTVLDEDVYTNTLSGIIARDYFPGLLEMQVKQEYLEALDSRDEEWIATSKRRLTDLMLTPERARNRSEPSDPVITTNRTEIRHVGDTPTGWGGDTPMSVMSMASSSPAQHLKDNHSSNLSNLGLLEFQAKYTSEDNESFNKLLDKQNTKRREKYAWIWSGNKIPSARQIAHHQREAKRVEEQGLNPYQDKQLATKKDFDSRPAKPDSWKARSENSLMFTPSSVEDTLETLQQKAEASSRAGPKRVVYQNTRLPDEGLKSTQDGGALPPSPSISAIKDAIAGRPRPSDSEAGYSGSETPRVNGYAFVDEDEPDYPTNNLSKDSHAGFLEDLRLLGTSDKTPNPFKIRENRRREDLHHRVVDRVARKKRAEKVAQETKSPVTMTPRFASSPRLDFGLRMPGRATVGRSGSSKLLTPAAQKLLHRMGNTPRPTESSSSNLKNVWTPTPRRAK